MYVRRRKAEGVLFQQELLYPRDGKEEGGKRTALHSRMGPCTCIFKKKHFCSIQRADLLLLHANNSLPQNKTKKIMFNVSKFKSLTSLPCTSRPSSRSWSMLALGIPWRPAPGTRTGRKCSPAWRPGNETKRHVQEVHSSKDANEETEQAYSHYVLGNESTLPLVSVGGKSQSAIRGTKSYVGPSLKGPTKYLSPWLEVNLLRNFNIDLDTIRVFELQRKVTCLKR